MQEYSTKRGNAYMCLSLMLGNMLVFGIYVVAGIFQGITGPPGPLDVLLHPVALVLVAQLCVAFIPFLAYLGYTNQRVRDVLPMRKVSPLNIFLITLITLTIMPLAMLVGAVTNVFFENNIIETVSGIAEMNLPLSILIIGIVPSIFEEISLRGVVLSNYRHVDIRVAALANGLFFGLMHLNPFQFFYAFLLGYIFSFFVFYTGSIFSAIYAHFIFNTTQLLLLRWALSFAQTADVVAEEPSMAVQVISMFIVAAIFTPVTVILFKSFKGINRKRVLKEELSMKKRARSLAALEEDEHHIKDAARLREIETLRGPGPGERQRVVTLGFVLTIIVYIILVLPIFL